MVVELWARVQVLLSARHVHEADRKRGRYAPSNNLFVHCPSNNLFCVKKVVGENQETKVRNLSKIAYCKTKGSVILAAENRNLRSLLLLLLHRGSATAPQFTAPLIAPHLNPQLTAPHLNPQLRSQLCSSQLRKLLASALSSENSQL